MEVAFMAVTAVAVALVLYHHVLWPQVLRWLVPRYGALRGIRPMPNCRR